MSDGADSTPTDGMIIAEFFLAVSSCFWIISLIQGVSPAGVDVVSTVASACFDDGRRVQMVGTNGVDDDLGLLGQRGHLRGRNASRDD